MGRANITLVMPALYWPRCSSAHALLDEAIVARDNDKELSTENSNEMFKPLREKRGETAPVDSYQGGGKTSPR